MPRWVKVFIAVGIILAVGFIVTLLAGVQHGPDIHEPRPAQGSSPSSPGP
jgi:hypothetical protein